MTGLNNFNNSTRKRVLNLLETGYLRFMELVIKRTTITKFRVNNEQWRWQWYRHLTNQGEAGYSEVIIVGFEER